MIRCTLYTVPNVTSSSGSFGLSDLHGDGRVHEPSGPDTPSGLGLELTFRLRREPGETTPPTWPAAMLQALAKYVLQSGESTRWGLAMVAMKCGEWRGDVSGEWERGDSSGVKVDGGAEIGFTFTVCCVEGDK